MKKIIFFIVLMSNLFSFGQDYQIEIRLVGANIEHRTIQQFNRLYIQLTSTSSAQVLRLHSAQAAQ
jgi:hypothetical protein